MNMKRVFSLGLAVIAIGMLLVFPTYAQESEPTLVPVSGDAYYFPETLYTTALGDTMYAQATDEEFYSGDFEGTAKGSYRVFMRPDGSWDTWLLGEFEGTVLGEYEGTMTWLWTWTLYDPTSEWFAKWRILSGTGDLENVWGSGTAWGPGWNPEDPESTEPSFFYKGELIIPGG
jgi:hypothetical protein